MSVPAYDLLIPLITAHLLADYVFQTTDMVLNKRRPAVLLMHGIHIFCLTALLTGGMLPLALGVTLIHITIDAAKVHLAPDTLMVYLSDQAAHALTLVFAVGLLPAPMFQPLWANLPPEALYICILTSGLITAALFGGPVVGHIMAGFKEDAQPKGLENAGRIIGVMERTLIFLMVVIGEPTGIGFLIAAKSILRFNTVSESQKISEYVIIGTLASFGWALLASFATLNALTYLGY